MSNLKRLPMCTEPLTGYLCLKSPGRDFNVKYHRASQRFVFHDFANVCKDNPQDQADLEQLLLGNKPDSSDTLQQHLAGMVDELQCVFLTADFKEQQQQQQPGSQQLCWLKNVHVQDVQQTGPGSRAYTPGQRLQAVVPQRDIQKHEVIGLYMGYVLDGEECDTDLDAEDLLFHRFQHSFEVRPTYQRSKRVPAPSGQRSISHFLVDASPCLTGNPLAQMLDFRAFTEGWVVDEARCVCDGPNAMLLPFSDNSTGHVYVAVLALRAISVAAGEDICIDYGMPYWDVKRDHDGYLQRARMQVAQQVHELKQELKSQADQYGGPFIAVQQALKQLVQVSDAAVWALSRHPGAQEQVAQLAAATAEAHLVLNKSEPAIAAAVAAEVTRQVQAELLLADARHEAAVAALQQQLQEQQAAEKQLQEQRLEQQQGVGVSLRQLQQKQEAAMADVWQLLQQHKQDNTLAQLLRRLKSTDVLVQEAAAKEVVEAVIDQLITQKASAGKQDLIRTLVQHLSSSSTEVQAAAVLALDHLAADADAACKAAIVATPGCLSGLVGLLSSSNTMVQLSAAEALGNLAADAAEHMAAIAATPSCLSSLVGLLSSSHTFVQASAAGALCDIAAGDDAAVKAAIAATPGCLKELKRLAKRTSAPQRLLHAANTALSLLQEHAPAAKGAARSNNKRSRPPQHGGSDNKRAKRESE